MYEPWSKTTCGMQCNLVGTPDYESSDERLQFVGEEKISKSSRDGRSSKDGKVGKDSVKEGAGYRERFA